MNDVLKVLPPTFITSELTNLEAFIIFLALLKSSIPLTPFKRNLPALPNLPKTGIAPKGSIMSL